MFLFIQKKIKEQKGQAIIELSAMILILSLFLFSLYDFTRFFVSFIDMTATARECARIGSLYNSSTTKNYTYEYINQTAWLKDYYGKDAIKLDPPYFDGKTPANTPIQCTITSHVPIYFSQIFKGAKNIRLVQQITILRADRASR